MSVGLIRIRTPAGVRGAARASMPAAVVVVARQHRRSVLATHMIRDSLQHAWWLAQP